MDYKDLANKFIEDGAWDGVPAIAVRLFAQWLEEHEAAEQGLQQTVATVEWVCACGLSQSQHIGVSCQHRNSG